MPGGWLVLGGGTYDYIARDAKNNATLATKLKEMCVNILTPYYKFGQDKDFPPVSVVLSILSRIILKASRQLSFNVQGSGDNAHVNARSDAHVSLIREIADASAVLLKNTNNALPLALPASIAIIGEDAKPPKKVRWVDRPK